MNLKIHMCAHTHIDQQSQNYWTWWHMPIILALTRLREKNHGFKINLGYIGKSYFKRE